MNEKSVINLIDKTKLTITGVNKITSFDSKHFNIDTILGDLVITGDSLEMEKLDTDSKELFINGNVYKISYQEIKTPKENLLKKLFK